MGFNSDSSSRYFYDVGLTLPSSLRSQGRVFATHVALRHAGLTAFIRMGKDYKVNKDFREVKKEGWCETASLALRSKSISDCDRRFPGRGFATAGLTTFSPPGISKVMEG